jgi:hypothetical protein
MTIPLDEKLIHQELSVKEQNVIEFILAQLEISSVYRKGCNQNDEFLRVIRLTCRLSHIDYEEFVRIVQKYWNIHQNLDSTDGGSSDPNSLLLFSALASNDQI